MSSASNADMMASTSYSAEISDPNTDLREHKLTRKRLLNVCSVCRRSIGFGEGIFECHVCQKMVHSYCKDSLPPLCVPVPNTSTGVKKSGMVTDYAPKVAPYVPSLVVRCIAEVESRGMEEKSLYAQEGDLAKAKEMARDYLVNQKVPDLSQVDIHTVASTLKIYLKFLSEPLITDELRHDFASASLISSKKKKDIELSLVIWNLPPRNRKTLAYLIRHLRFVNYAARRNIRSLAIIFGPIVVGGSSQYLTPPPLITPRDDQIAIVESLLEINDFSDFIQPYRSEYCRKI